MTDQPANVTVEYSISFILQQIVLLQADTAYLHESISSLAKMPDGDSGDCGSPGNIMGAEKAEALGRIVESRETTNQRLLQLYEKMYDDLSKRE